MVLDMSPAKSNEVHRTKSIDLERAANGSLRRSRDESSESERLLSIRTIISGSNLKKKKGAKNLEIVFIVVFQLSSSILMSLINKSAVGYLSFPISLLVLQTLGTLIILEGGKVLKLLHYEGFKWEKGGRKFLGVAIAFVMPMVFNMFALKFVSVATVVVFRQVSTALVAIGEYFFFQKRFRILVIVSILLGILGSIMYGFTASDFHFLGYVYSFFYAVTLAVNSLYVKSIFDSLPKMSNWEKTYYQNLEGLPFLVMMAVPIESISSCLAEMKTLNVQGWLVIIVSCVAGFMISVAGTLSRTALSPTSFNILGNMSKPMTVIFSFFIFGAETSLNALAGLSMVLISGIMYSYASRSKR